MPDKIGPAVGDRGPEKDGVGQQPSSNQIATRKQHAQAFNWHDHLAVHPAAEAFPPLPEKELKELADDIKRNGLEHSITLWRPDDKTKPVLLDGRNRLDALALLEIGRAHV